MDARQKKLVIIAGVFVVGTAVALYVQFRPESGSRAAAPAVTEGDSSVASDSPTGQAKPGNLLPDDPQSGVAGAGNGTQPGTGPGATAGTRRDPRTGAPEPEPSKPSAPGQPKLIPGTAG
jgi:hypothetical protein